MLYLNVLKRFKRALIIIIVHLSALYGSVYHFSIFLREGVEYTPV